MKIIGKIPSKKSEFFIYKDEYVWCCGNSDTLEFRGLKMYNGDKVFLDKVNYKPIINLKFNVVKFGDSYILHDIDDQKEYYLTRDYEGKTCLNYLNFPNITSNGLVKLIDSIKNGNVIVTKDYLEGNFVAVKKGPKYFFEIYDN